MILSGSIPRDAPVPADSVSTRHWATVLPAVVGLVLFVTALEVLRAEVHKLGWSDLMSDVRATPRAPLAIAILLTAMNYVVLTGYDLVAFISIGKTLPRPKVMVASFVAYSVSNNVGFSALSGASVRYRFYTRWGVSPQDLARIVFSYSVTFWLGLLALGGLSLTAAPIPQLIGPHAAQIQGITGWVLMLIPIGYIAATAIRRAPLRLWRLEVRLPTTRVAGAQLVLSVVDWALAAAVLYVLLPPSALSFLAFMALFLIAILLGMISHVPGGLGVFEGLMVLLLQPYFEPGRLLPALVVFRAVYYLAPLTIGLLLLIADELQQHHATAVRATAIVDRVAARLTPQVLAAFTFLSGVVLLCSGATPAIDERITTLGQLVPLEVIEASHFTASVVGTILLVLSQGLARRLDVAYSFSVVLLTLGIATSLLKGFDYEEASVLLIVLLLLHHARSAFDRRAALFDTRFSPGWIACVLGAVGASLWLGLFAYEHVNYAHELWWKFELRGDASRYLRSSVGAAMVLLITTFSWLIGYAHPHAPPPSPRDLDAAQRAIGEQSSTLPNLVFLKDKALLFDDDRRTFLMYAVQGRSWVALGDPVGQPNRLSAVVQRFLERCDDYGGVPVFYQVTPAHLHLYADVGLTLVKLGEEARVELSGLTLEGSHAAKLRQPLHRLARERGTFRVVDAGQVLPLLSELRAVSDEWLSHKATAEKGFSLGYFDAEYLCRFPLALIERDGRIEAFANVWCGADQYELSIDLMRHRREAPPGVMDALLVHLMQWGKEHGYRWFVLGMAPLSGFAPSSVAPLWNRVGGFVYEHGEPFYNFQGLRAYKEKFGPTWEPRYLAYPGGLGLPRILADVSALIAGGYRRIFAK